MSSSQPSRRWYPKLWLLFASVALAGAAVYFLLAPSPPAAPEVVMALEPPEATSEEVHRLCAACHAYPPPESFPRSAWRKEVKRGYDFFHENLAYRFDYPPLEAVVRYYENRAPETLSALPRTVAPHPPRIQFERRGYGPPGSGPPGATHVGLVRLLSKDKVDVLVCDALNNQVLVLSPGEPPTWKVIARGLCCAHAEVVDLDGDGINDVVLAVLGTFHATDDRVGSVVWLKGAADGTFTPITLLDGVGRVADVRAANFSGTGKLDLVVAEFGWHKAGKIHLLENRTTDPKKPVFVPRILDERHGTTHVPVGDLNGDGKLDFVAVISQEHETVVAFLNEGGGKFRKETLYSAPHPAFGSHGVQLVDLDGDGKLDVLLANGDALDPPYLLKPYHGLTWLRNEGCYPFTPQRLADCYGTGSPVVADFEGKGRSDIVFVTFLPAAFFPHRAAQHLESVVLLEQTTPGKFVRHVLETETCDHLTCAVGDLDGDGRPDLVIGSFIRGAPSGPNAPDCVTIWRNTTEKPLRGANERVPK